MTLSELRRSLRMPALVLAMIIPALAYGGERAPSVDYVSWYYKPESAFKRISEYFGGAESTRGRLILRSQAEQRDGLYFVLRTSGPLSALPADGTLTLEYIAAGDARPRQAHHPINIEATDSRREIWIGFTGTDAPGREDPPVAWSVVIRDASGSVVQSRNSHLWQMPSADGTKIAE